MKKNIAICIPTYKRMHGMIRCIDSVIDQIESESFYNNVCVYIANDASPDETDSCIKKYVHLNFFSHVTRKENLGMSKNIREMLYEASLISDYQLIITDDDYLVPGALKEIFDLINNDKGNKNIIWTPRYSYTEDGELHCIVCDKFSENKFIQPSPSNTGRYMANGFILSGLILNASKIDYDFWRKNEDNSFFPVIFFGDILSKHGAFFWKKEIVHHTVLNECHWERWGKNDIAIEMKLFLDFAKTYFLISGRYSSKERVLYYFNSIPEVFSLVSSFMRNEKLHGSRKEILEVINGLKYSGGSEINEPVRFFIKLSLSCNRLIILLKKIILKFLIIFSPKNSKKENYIKKIEKQKKYFSATKFINHLIK